MKRWLDPQLNQPVGIQSVGFNGWAELVKDAPGKAGLYLKNDEVIAVISLLDLYGPTIFPSHIVKVEERYDWAKKEMEERVGHEKFRQHFAVHEVEAWLLSNPDIFPASIKKGFPGKIVHPETVNFNEPPAKLLTRLFKKETRRTYKKVVHGQEFFGQLDPVIACKKCPKLKLMLNDMLQLARKSGL